MATKLYFHDALSTDPGTLPTSTQSGSTINANADAQTVNRSMDKKIGTSQTSKVVATLASASAQNLYFTKFVSQRLKGTSVAANTWTFQFAGQESNAAANFPVTTSAALVKIVAYVWDAVAGSKIGNILIGNGGTYAEAGTAETALTGTFTGSAVSGFTAGHCVIIIEIFFTVTQGGATTRNDTFYYDGTTEASTTTNAAFLSTPETIGFQYLQSISESVTITESVKKLITKGISDTDVFTATDSVSKKVNKVIIDTLTSLDSISSKTVKGISISDAIASLDNVSKLDQKALSELTAITDSVSKKITKSISDTLTSTDLTTKTHGFKINISDTTQFQENLSKSLSKLILENITIDDLQSKGIQKTIEDLLSSSDDVSFSHLLSSLVDDIIQFSDSVLVVKSSPIPPTPPPTTSKPTAELVHPLGPFVRLIPKTIALEINITGKITLSKQQVKDNLIKKKNLHDLKVLQELIELL